MQIERYTSLLFASLLQSNNIQIIFKQCLTQSVIIQMHVPKADCLATTRIIRKVF